MALRKIGIPEEKIGVCDNSQAVHPQKKSRGNRENVDEFAAYAFDILQSLREASTQERHKFLGYLMGMAAEEAIRLAEGQQSAAAQFGVRTKEKGTPARSSRD